MSQNHPSGRRRLSRILALAVATVLFIAFYVPAARLRTDDMTTREMTAGELEELKNGVVFRQVFSLPANMALKELRLRFDTYGRANRGKIDVSLYEDDAEVAAWSVSAADIVDGAPTVFTPETPIPINGKSTYAFSVSESFRGRNAVGLWMDITDDTGYFVNGEARSWGAICSEQVYGYKNPNVTAHIVLGYVAMLLLFGLGFFIYDRREKLGARARTLSTALTLRLMPRSTDVTVLDWVIYAVFALYCFFTMLHPDILHTGASSFALLRGHFLDFYEYNAPYFGGNSYMISTYILFAIWNIPLAALGLMGPPTMNQPIGVRLWFKALPVTLFIASALVFYRLCRKFEDKTGLSAKWGTFLFLLTPTAFYSQYMFGQYDVFTVFFMALALKKLFDEREHSLAWFSVLFGIATTFKYHALLFYIPILLYREKRLSKLIKSVVCYGLPILLVNLPYLASGFFSSGVEGFSALDYFFAAYLGYYAGGTWKLYLVPVIWVAFCVYAYVRATADEPFERLRDIAYLTGLVVWLAFGVVFWHPQWLMIATPFLALSLLTSRRRDILCLLDLGFAVVFLNFVECTWPGTTQAFYNKGILANLVANRQTLAAIDLGRFCPLKSNNILFTAISGILLARALLLRPEWDRPFTGLKREAEAVWFRVRGFVGIAVLVVPMLVCLASEIKAPTFRESLRFDRENGKIMVDVDTAADLGDFMIAVWSIEGDQDDVAWYTLEPSGDTTWHYEVDLARHNTLGWYNVHFYNGTRFLTGDSIEVDALPEAS